MRPRDGGQAAGPGGCSWESRGNPREARPGEGAAGLLLGVCAAGSGLSGFTQDEGADQGPGRPSGLRELAEDTCLASPRHVWPPEGLAHWDRWSSPGSGLWRREGRPWHQR